MVDYMVFTQAPSHRDFTQKLNFDATHRKGALFPIE